MQTNARAYRLALGGAYTSIAGILLSGPLGLLLVMWIAPQPLWQGAKVYVEHFHAIQTLPFFFGFLLVLGYLAMLTGIHSLAEENEKPYTLIAALLTTIFVALIFFNYINQTTFLPALVRNYLPEYDGIISAFSFSNPNSLCWAIEMWGYAFLGLATAFASVVFHRNRTERITAGLMIANAVMSVVGGFIACINLSWVFTTAGLVSYQTWNLLVLVLSIFVALSLRKRQKGEGQG